MAAGKQILTAEVLQLMIDRAFEAVDTSKVGPILFMDQRQMDTAEKFRALKNYKEGMELGGSITINNVAWQTFNLVLQTILPKDVRSFVKLEDNNDEWRGQ